MFTLMGTGYEEVSTFFISGKNGDIGRANQEAVPRDLSLVHILHFKEQAKESTQLLVRGVGSITTESRHAVGMC